jgi:hypothetical protein
MNGFDPKVDEWIQSDAYTMAKTMAHRAAVESGEMGRILSFTPALIGAKEAFSAARSVVFRPKRVFYKKNEGEK